MSILNYMAERMAPGRVTLLGAGPMSLRVTDSIIELANFYKKPVAMIPSRRQVDASDLGGGYVQGWSTEEFSKYVRSRDLGGHVLLSRDHSGPWQLSVAGADGSEMSHSAAMEEVKASLRVDLSSGFDLIHIDPSKGLEHGRSQLEVEDDILELLEFCQSNQQTPTFFEVGADEQSQFPDQVDVAEASLVRVLNRVRRNGLQAPIFYVIQTGTKVMEARNIGAFDSELPVDGMLPATVQLPEILRMCRRNGVFLKEHNADYLSDAALSWHRRFGIHAANVAPEFGVAETRAIIQIAEEISDDVFLNEFGEHVIQSGKWGKWMIPNSSASDMEKIEIAGHYHFSDEVGSKLLQDLEVRALRKGVEYDRRLRAAVRSSIDRYLREFGYGVKI